MWSGKGAFKNLDKFFARLERRNYRVHVRVLLARYRAYDECSDCGGSRLKSGALRVQLDGTTISELSSWSIERLRAWLGSRSWEEFEEKAASHFLEELTGETRTSIAYPFGFHDDETDRAAEELGLLAGLATERRPVTTDDVLGRWAIPRYDVNDCFDRSTNAPTRAVLEVE